MKKSKVLLTVMIGCITVVMLHCIAAFAAPAKDAKYSVDAAEIEYDMKSGDGTTTGKTTIKHDGGVAVAQGGSTFNSKSRTGRLYGGVVADKEDNHLKSEELIMYTDKFVSAVGNAILVKGLSSVDGSWLSAGKIVYDMKSGVANATGGVTMENKPQKMTGSGDRAVYNSNETGYIELIGNAQATQDGNTVTGDKLRITNVSSPDSKTHAQGNVTMVCYPKEDNENVNNPAFGEGAVLMANGQTNFNPESNMLDRVKEKDFATEDKTA